MTTASNAPSLWLPYREPRANPTARLFCFPPAGAGASFYRPWERLTPADIELCAVQPPGRETRFGEPVVSELSVLLEDLATPVGMLADRPIAFLGYSFGALLAFELACLVRAKFGIKLHAFVACAFPPPHGLPPQRPDGSPPPDSELTALLRNFGGTPPEVLADPELLALQLRPLRADYTLLARHPRGPARTLDCPILALSGRQDSHAGPELMQGWAEATGGEFSHRDFAGGHFFVFDHLETFCQAVFAHLRAR